MNKTSDHTNGWSLPSIKQLVMETYQEWNDDQAPRLGAALAYYTVLSIAPLLIIVIAIAGFVFGRDAAQGQIFYQIREMVGSEGASTIEEMIKGASNKESGVLASLIGFVTLLFGATSVVAELRYSMNIIWDVPADPQAGLKDVVKERSYALAVVLGCGFLLLVSLVVSAGLAAAGKFIEGWLPLPEFVLMAFNFVLAIGVLTGIFSILFKVLPEVDIHWRDVLLGAAVTAVLFSIGKLVLGLYLGKASFGSTYGTAGSVIIILVWVYYSSQIFFFGAEFTQMYARRHGSDPSRRFREFKRAETDRLR
ncbi:MAG TPA: YihY/virulence factor BrkB family protein [Bryobacteraceae bacterium]|nr:YihY/virulence factor BrkB family protein [Bryobacteraceae bacterium]